MLRNSRLGLLQKYKFWLCLDNIRSAYNVGAMFRTADATGIWGIITCGITPNFDHVRVAKTALGAQKSVESLRFANTMRFLQFLEDNNLIANLWSLELTDRAEDIFKLDFTQKQPYPIFLTVGNEIDGVSAQILVKSSKHVYIPMNGIKVSLNVAEAASIAMYEFYRKIFYT